MHTDEYEISMSREINWCQKIIDKLLKNLQRREEEHGMSTEAFRQAFEQNQFAERSADFQDWYRDYQELQIMRKRLNDNREALRIAKQM